MARHCRGMVWNGRDGMALHSILGVWYDMGLVGVWHGMVWAWHGMVRFGMAW